MISYIYKEKNIYKGGAWIENSKSARAKVN